MTDPITAEQIEELERLGSLADAGTVLIERRDDDDGSLDYVLYGPVGDVAASFETANNNARSNAEHLAALRNAAPQLISAAKRSLEYEAFFREHGAHLADVVGMVLRSRGFRAEFGGLDGRERSACDALSALLERLK